jgi:hypothetical protein
MAVLIVFGTLDSPALGEGEQASAEQAAPAAGRLPAFVQVTAEAVAPSSETIFTLPWGAGPGEAGLQAPLEGLARGPQALAVAPDGIIYVLDSVNRRLLTLSPAGEVLRTTAVPLNDARFLATSASADYVLDADCDRRLLAFDKEGHQALELDLPPLDGPVTALQVRGNRVFVEVLHERVYELAVGPGRGPVLSAVAGRPADATGCRQAQARFRRGAPALLEWGDSGSPGSKAHTEVAFPFELRSLVSLDASKGGDLILGGRLEEKAARSAGADILVTTISTDGSVSPALLLRDGSEFAFLGEPYAVGPDGSIYQPHAGPEGYSIAVHKNPGGKK